MRGESSNESFILCDGALYRLQVLEQPIHPITGQPCRCCRNDFSKSIDVMESLPHGERSRLIAQALDLPDGPLVWQLRSLSPVPA